MTGLIVGGAIAFGAALVVILDRRPLRDLVALAFLLGGVALAQGASGDWLLAAIQLAGFAPAIVIPIYAMIRENGLGSELPRSEYFSVSKLLGTISVVLIFLQLSWMSGSNPVAVLGLAVFFAGAAGAILRRNAFTFVMCVVVMLNGASLAALSGGSGDFQYVLMGAAVVMTWAGLGVVRGVYRTRGTVDLDELDVLRDEA